MISGMLLVHKPAGPTSHDVVQAARRTLGIRRIGHSGTLDPMAEGLLILLVGPATSRQQAFQGHDKVYEATLRLGTQTDTGDATGRPVRTAPVPPLDRNRIETLFAELTGPQVQRPPAYSAVKVRGRPAYWWTRKQQPVELAPRTVQVSALALTAFGSDTLAFQVHCSAGTYVRTLAETIAERLGTIGHLAALTRTRIGGFRLEDAKPLAWLQSAGADEVTRVLQPVA